MVGDIAHPPQSGSTPISPPKKVRPCRPAAGCKLPSRPTKETGMRISRRELSVGCGMGALAWAAGRMVPGATLIGAAQAAPLPLERLKELAAFALQRARKAGATYADIRINR